MSLFAKNLKSILKNEEFNYNQTQSKNYNKMYLTLTEKKEGGSSNNTINNDNIFINTNNFNGEMVKEKVISWFFSLPLESRIKIATVENSFIALMIFQMHANYRSDSKIVFQIKSDSSNETNTIRKEKLAYKTGDITGCKDEDLFKLNIMNFFNYKSNKTINPLVENIWFSELRFFSIHSDLDCLTLSPRVFKDPTLFNYYFKYIGNTNSFFSLIKPYQDSKTKTYTYNLPDWMDVNGYHTLGNFVIAFIEQAILIKYVLNYNKKDKLLYSLVNEKKMAESFLKRKEVIGCLNKYFDNEKKNDLFNYIKIRTIFNDINYDKSITNIINNMNRHPEQGFQSFRAYKMDAVKEYPFYSPNDFETEKKIIDKFKNDHPINFVDDTLYHGLDSYFSKNYFISKRLFEDLHSLYTDKNYEELIKDMETSEECNKNSNKKGKKKKSKCDGGNIQSNIKMPSKSDLHSKEEVDMEFYSVYYNESKSQVPKPTNTNFEVKTESYSFSNDKIKISINRKEINKHIYQKDLFDAYNRGNKEMIQDYIKNYIIKEIIEMAINKAETNKNIKTTTCMDFINDLCSINNKSKIINNFLNDNKNNIIKYEKKQIDMKEDENKILSTDSNAMICGTPEIEKKLESELITISNKIGPVASDNENITCIEFEEGSANNKNIIKESTESKTDASYNFNESEDNKILENKNSLSAELIKKVVDDHINTIDIKQSEHVEYAQSSSTASITSIKHLEEHNDTVKQKKKKKEPNFFLYEITNKKKDKFLNNSSNTNQNMGSFKNNLTTNQINQANLINSKPNSNSNSCTSASDNFIEKKENKTEKSNHIDKFPRNSPNIDKINILSNSNSHNLNDNQSKSNYIKNFENCGSPKEKNYKNFYSGRNQRGHRSSSNHSKRIASNNYYIINSITHVNGMMNPMMMFLNPLNGYNPMNLSQSNTRNDSNMSSLVGNINFNKYSNDFLTFVYKLHNDIITYHKNVNDTLDLMKEVKIYVIQYIEKLINNQISDNFSIDIYGSFASDLSIESSDIDIKIRLKVNEHQYENEYGYGHEKSKIQLDLDNFIMIIVKNFNELKIFENVIPINTATVPIIKIVCDPRTIADDDNQMRLEEFKNSEYYKNYKFNKEEIEKIKIDITFLDMINKNSINFNSTNSLLNNNQMSSVEFAKNNLILYPEIKPLLQIIKRFLQINKLNSCFNGGLSSFCLFLLILAFIKFKSISQSEINQYNLGRLLLDFLEFYGRIFNFHSCSIDVNMSNPYILKTDIIDSSPVIFDPLSYLNASKSSFRIDEVKYSFSDALDFLSAYKLKYDKIDSSANNSNIVYDLLLKSK